MTQRLLDIFHHNAEINAAKVSRVSSVNDAIPLIREFLREQGMPEQIRLSPQMAGEWPENTGIDISVGSTDGNDLVCVSRAWGAVADTGTLVMLSGQDNPTRLNFLADFHLVFIDGKQIQENKSGVWEKLRLLPKMPRAVNFISGPSRTADIEQTIQLGAHGPRHLWIFLETRN